MTETQKQVTDLLLDVSKQMRHRIELIIESQESSCSRNYNDLLGKNAELLERGNALRESIVSLKKKYNPESMNKLENQNANMFDKLREADRKAAHLTTERDGLRKDLDTAKKAVARLNNENDDLTKRLKEAGDKIEYYAEENAATQERQAISNDIISKQAERLVAIREIFDPEDLFDA